MTDDTENTAVEPAEDTGITAESPPDLPESGLPEAVAGSPGDNGGGEENYGGDTEELDEDQIYRSAYRQAKSQAIMQKALDQVARETSRNNIDELERTDVEDLWEPTSASPEDEQERTDMSDVLGLSEEDNREIFGTGSDDSDFSDILDLTPEDEEELLDVGNATGSDDDLSDLFEVKMEDIMGRPPRPRRKPVRPPTPPSRRQSPPGGGLGSMRYF